MYKTHLIPAFNDNYIWVIEDSHGAAYVVDPGCGQSVIDYLTANEIQLVGILITHHHKDHTGGIALLQQAYGQQLSVYGPANEAIDGLTVRISLAEHTSTELNLKHWQLPILVYSVPGHTIGHIAYLADDNLFCGDTLFSGGCGRLFEGSAAQMSKSLCILAALPDSTKVYCAHEYTQTNLKFAITVMPNNQALKTYIEQVISLRQQGLPTIPSSIRLEKQINPFLRCDQKEIKLSVSSHFNQKITDNIQAFKNLRLWKDNF
jgi:hydroxyacylglutathione hydrolase